MSSIRLVKPVPPINPDKLVPFDVEAEEAVLGSLLITPGCIVDVAPFLKSTDFYREQNGWTYRAALNLYDRREGIDFITVRDELERMGKLTEAGGMAFLTGLLTVVPTSTHIEHYARMVERAAVRRRVIGAASEAANVAYDDSLTTEQIREQAEAAIFRAVGGERGRGGFRTVGEYLADIHEEMWAEDNARPPLLTGIADLDEMLGGLQRGDLTIIAGRPGTGKTSLLDTIAYNAMHGGSGVAMFSLEMKGVRITRRLLRMMTGIPGHRLRLKGKDLRDQELTAFNRASAILDGLPLAMCEQRGMTITAVRRLARQWHARRPYDLLMLDYLQLVRVEGDNLNRNSELEEIVNVLREMAAELDVHVLVASQFNRGSERRGEDARPMLSDLRDSGAIEQAADNVVGLWHAAPTANPPAALPAEAIILKQREGRTDTVPVGWWGARSMFVNLSDVRRINEMAGGAV